MSKSNIHRKLRVAYSAVIESNKVKSDLKETVISGTCKTVCAFLCVHGHQSSTPALSLQLEKYNGDNELYVFNLNSTMDKHLPAAKRRLSGMFFTRLDFKNQGYGCLSLLKSKFLSSPAFSGLIPCKGPPGLQKYLSSVYSFLFTPATYERFFNRVKICENNMVYSENGITVKQILCPSSMNESASSYSGVTASYVCQINNFCQEIDWDKLLKWYKPSNQVEKGYFPGRLPFLEEEDITDAKSSYQLKNDYFPGHFEEDVALTKSGIQNAHALLYKLLISDDFEMPDGVCADDLLKPQYAPTFAVIDCPTEQHFECLVKSPTLVEHQCGANEHLPSAVAHITPRGIFYSDIYQQWLAKFGASCKHLVINDENKLQYHKHEHVQIYTFNKICDKVFPLLRKDFAPSEEACFDKENVAKASAGLTLVMTNDRVEKWSCQTLEENLTAIDLALETALKSVKNVSSNAIFKEPGDQDYYPRLIALGTGSSHNHKYRSAPGFLILLDEKNSVLLDCGGGALERIHFIFGEEAETILASIKLILLSHFHIDHHLSFFGIIEKVIEAQREKNLNKKIFCLMPFQMCSQYKSFINHLDSEGRIEFCALEQSGQLKMKSYIEESLGVRSVNPVRVLHSILTYGISLVTGCGKKIVYSSDSLPMCRDLIVNGKNADLLIHDCLYVDDELEVEAAMRKHSALGGALKTSRAMGAKFTLLTHFTPAAPVQPVCEFPEDVQGKVAVAYDFLSVSLADLHELPKLQPLVHAVYIDSIKRANLTKKSRNRSIARRKALVQNLMSLL